MRVNLGPKIKELRKRLKINQDELAYKIGITKKQISQIENEKAPLPADAFRKIRVLLKVNLCWLLIDEKPMLIDEHIQDHIESNEFDKFHMESLKTSRDPERQKLYDEQMHEINVFFAKNPQDKAIVKNTESYRHEVEHLFRDGFFTKPHVWDILSGLTFLSAEQMSEVASIIKKLEPDC